MPLHHKFNIHLCISMMMLLFSAPFASADIAIIINKANDTPSLNAAEIKRIFLGKIDSYPNGKIITPFDQDESTDIYNRFISRVLNKKNEQMTSYRTRQLYSGKSRPPKKIKGTDKQVIDAVANNIDAIAYIDAANVNDSVKAALIIIE